MATMVTILKAKQGMYVLSLQAYAVCKMEEFFFKKFSCLWLGFINSFSL
jgi:hypothetical protein